MKKKSVTPVRACLVPESTLLPNVYDGLDALQTAHKPYLAEAIRADFDDSIDIDDALKPGRETENRWDYLLGHGPSGRVVAVEPHSAKDEETSTVIAKKRAAREQLKHHLRTGASIDRWLWVASGNVQFANTEKTRLRLDQAGITFVGKQVLPRHLPSAEPSSGTARGGQRK